MEVSIHIAAIVFGSTAVGATLVSVDNLHRNTPLWMVIHNMALMVSRPVSASDDDERDVIMKDPVNLVASYFNNDKIYLFENELVYLIHAQIGLVIALSSVYSMLDKIHTNFPLYEIYIAVCIGLWVTTLVTQYYYRRRYKQQRVINKLRK